MPRGNWTLLRRALAVNLVFSALSGTVLCLFSRDIAAVLGAAPPSTGLVLGPGLILFAALIAWTLWRLRLGLALAISALDMVWVCATVPLIFVPGLLSPTGTQLVLTVAGIVALLGALQLAGLDRIMRTGVTNARQYRHCIRVHSKAEPDALWSVIRDLGAISRYSAGLKDSRLAGATAQGAVRVCTGRGGESWAEEVLEINDRARNLVLRFCTEASDFPFPFTAMTGGWTVRPAERGGALVDIWWTVTPKQRHLGWLIVALMTIALDRDMPRIVDAMEATAMGGEPVLRRRAPALAYC